MDIDQFLFEDDGTVPNNPECPLLLYHDVFLRDGAVLSSEAVIDAFEQNGWSGAWINGIFPYHHYHARAHEVLANVGAPVEVQFGGPSGVAVTFPTGAAVVIPAGVGHCRLSGERGLKIVGAYPAGQEGWDLKRADNPAHYAQAKQEIAQVACPDKDPVTGTQSPLGDHWG